MTGTSPYPNSKHNGGSHQVLSQIACAFGHDSIMQRENSESWGFATIETSGPEAELFVLAEKVESAEKTFHNALLCRNEAQIAYLRDPSIMTCLLYTSRQEYVR